MRNGDPHGIRKALLSTATSSSSSPSILGVDGKRCHWLLHSQRVTNGQDDSPSKAGRQADDDVDDDGQLGETRVCLVVLVLWPQCRRSKPSNQLLSSPPTLWRAPAEKVRAHHRLLQ